LTSRFEFLRDDIAIEMITYKQLNYIINTLDALIELVTEDKEFLDLIESKSNRDITLIKLLKPYIVTRNKEFTCESLDAAIKRLLSYNRLISERARW